MASNTVVLDGPAPTGGVVVTLTSSVPSAAQPQASVTVAAGKTTANFSITSFPVTANKPVTISASAGGITKTVAMTIVP